MTFYTWLIRPMRAKSQIEKKLLIDFLRFTGCENGWFILWAEPVMGQNIRHPSKMAEYGTLFTTSCLFLNICLSIGIVIINKWIYSHYGFPNITLTCMHFVFTTIGLLLCQQAGIFQKKSLPVFKMLPLSLTFCGFVVFTNLSLQTNTVGTYQLAKTLTTPCIIAIQMYFYDRQFSLKVRFTLVSDRPIVID